MACAMGYPARRCRAIEISAAMTVRLRWTIATRKSKMPRMDSPEAPFVHALWITALGCVLLAVTLSLLPRLGMAGWKVSETITKAPLLDLVVALFTWIPWLLAAVLG